MLCCALGAVLLSALLTWRKGLAMLSAVAGGWLASGVLAASALLLVAGVFLHFVPQSVAGPAGESALCLFE
ncbi:hypothetical protein [Fodinicurvata fenggangensis]|uniref:hypothetical protein n=1 Tax=Fodinicurvata fenggangensis TaxID=1121830 RepID=UPI00047E60B5|nr:hypothetical protein [Fodinicurvata fenggangensis]